MPSDLTSNVMVITGASSGIGAATAIAAAEAGMDLVLNARRARELEAVAEQVRERGAGAELVVGDVTEKNLSARLLDTAQERFGRFDVVFSNAGYGLQTTVHETADEQWRRIFEVNFFASLDLLREAARRLLAGGRRGHLLMCSSCLAKFTLPYYSAYSATKAAQNHVCRAMGLELKPYGIHVSSVHPVTTATEFFEVSTRLSGGDPEGKSVPDHSPKLFVQPPQRVARAIIKCVRRPRPEVWTSFTVRAVAGVMTVFPRLFDVAMRSQVKKKP